MRTVSQPVVALMLANAEGAGIGATGAEVAAAVSVAAVVAGLAAAVAGAFSASCSSCQACRLLNLSCQKRCMHAWRVCEGAWHVPSTEPSHKPALQVCLFDGVMQITARRGALHAYPSHEQVHVHHVLAGQMHLPTYL